MASHGGGALLPEPTYRMCPYDDEKFYPSRIEEQMQQVCEAFFEDKPDYEASKVEEWVQCLSSEILAAVRQTQHMPRYKLIVQVSVCQNIGQGIKISSKALADVNYDSWASCIYQKQSLVCSAMLFGFYHE